MAETEGIVLFKDNYEIIRDTLSFEQQGILLESLFDGEYSGSDPLVKIAFQIFFAAIQRSNTRYKERCEKNRQNAMKKHRVDEETRKKAAAYDNMRSHPIASDCMRTDASHTGADTGADTGAVALSSSLSADEIRETLRKKGASLTEIDAAMRDCEGIEMKSPANYLWTVILNNRKKAKKVLPSHDFPQRSYDGVDEEMMANLAREMEDFKATGMVSA